MPHRIQTEYLAVMKITPIVNQLDDQIPIYFLYGMHKHGKQMKIVYTNIETS